MGYVRMPTVGQLYKLKYGRAIDAEGQSITFFEASYFKKLYMGTARQISDRSKEVRLRAELKFFTKVPLLVVENLVFKHHPREHKFARYTVVLHNNKLWAVRHEALVPWN